MGGAGQVLLGTDYPHQTDIPAILANARELGLRETQAVLGGNAERLFRL